MRDTVLILGSGGQLGVELVREFSSRGYAVTGFTRAELDITDSAGVQEVIGRIEPAVVINSAAYNQVDAAEKEPIAAFQANALGVRNVAVACRQIDALLIHFSTDYVFDGAKGSSYVESDAPHPLGAYAVSKLAGELYAQAYLDEPLIIRTSGVFGPGGLHTARGNFLEMMLRLAKSGQTIRVVDDNVASPTYAPLLAAKTAGLVEKNARGVFHIGGGTPVSWYEYARTIFRVAGMDRNLLPTSQRDYQTPARRPKYSALSNARMESLGLEPFPPLEVAIQEYFQLRSAYASV